MGAGIFISLCWWQSDVSSHQRLEMGRIEEGMLSPHNSKELPMEATPALLGTGNTSTV